MAAGIKPGRLIYKSLARAQPPTHQNEAETGQGMTRDSHVGFCPGELVVRRRIT
jgi:hypothetical protein